ncbi:MAG: ParB/RepB/Spo0J family partition protein [Bacteroidetes bacterium]|nr:ParB/RepB/Spo0J family partition protein [Bacteroidota bacterium]
MAQTNNNKKQALGKGIRALLSSIDEELTVTAEGVPAVSGQNTGNIARLSVDLIEVNPKQPRRDFDEKALIELSESIKLHDIIQPVTVVKVGNNRYQLISGERRWRASKIAGLKDIPAYVRTADDQELLELALLENLQREDLNAIEIGMSYKRLMDECSMTQEQVADRMKKDRSTITNYIRLLKLPPDIQRAVRDGELSMGHARAIIGLDLVDQQLYVYREVKEKGLSVRQVEALVKDLLADERPDVAHTKHKDSQLPPAYKRIEDNMASHFSTKVKMERKRNGKGAITIEFYNDNDLERIMEKMNL